jgi:hypothetical protein
MAGVSQMAINEQKSRLPKRHKNQSCHLKCGEKVYLKLTLNNIEIDRKQAYDEFTSAATRKSPLLNPESPSHPDRHFLSHPALRRSPQPLHVPGCDNMLPAVSDSVANRQTPKNNQQRFMIPSLNYTIY